LTKEFEETKECTKSSRELDVVWGGEIENIKTEQNLQVAGQDSDSDTPVSTAGKIRKAMMFHKNSAIMNFKPKIINKDNNAKHDLSILDFENANTGILNIQDQNLADNVIWKEDNHNNSESVSEVESNKIKIAGEESVDNSVDASGNSIIFEYFPYILTS
jgi:hypothetical protein